MLIILSLVGVTGYGILQYYLNIYEKDKGKSLTDTYGFYGALSFVHYFISNSYFVDIRHRAQKCSMIQVVHRWIIPIE